MSLITANRETKNQPAATTVNKSDLNRVILAGVSGSAMEWYDFSIYGTASALVFSEVFFPGLDKLTALLATFATYAVGFLARPLGGLFFGRMGDRHGRKVVLVITVLLMGISTFCIGLLPAYETAGLWSTALLLALRLLQGFGSGAEQAGASLIVAEFAPAKQRGFYASLPFAGIIIGILLAALTFSLVQLLPDEDFMSWGWRIPFLASALVIIAGVIIRLKVKESPVFEALRKEPVTKVDPLKVLWADSRQNLIVACGLRVGENGTSYLYQVFTLSYLTKVLLIDKSIGTLGLMVAAGISMFTIPAIGWMSDRLGRRVMYRVTAAIALLWAFPAFILFETREPWLIVFSMSVAISLGAFGMYAVQGAWFPELFSARFRYTGIAVSKEFTSVVAGGIAPFVAAWLLELSGGQYWPLSVYIALLALISFISTFYAPETKGSDITQ
ncbi:MFS transporter [Serratia ficaria]|uniref:MFS transporter n=1 Tax=Serratia ficaria TaxID=61651 RepID=UPI00217919AB|nr:MFS transporter [Serratia ficaria]CAI0720534.1 Proline porter II [Serratia ficaria]CAI1581548.1 Proline porter II [Serratia ficaria]